MGLGAGSQDFTTANILRLWLGESVSHEAKIPAFAQSEKIAVLETQVDDLNPQIMGYLFDILFNAGAIDVFTQPVGMKKSRQGILLTVLCHLDAIAACQEVIFRETSTLGIRYSIQDRAILKREIQTVQTPYGEVRVKIAYTENLDPQNILNIQPEYEDCVDLAQKTGHSLQTIQQSAIATWHKIRL
jgi:pyridinium-3,5-bisthiocarboxylic acid mononucleotide nickel chelatase